MTTAKPWSFNASAEACPSRPAAVCCGCGGSCFHSIGFRCRSIRVGQGVELPSPGRRSFSVSSLGGGTGIAVAGGEHDSVDSDGIALFVRQKDRAAVTRRDRQGEGLTQTGSGVTR